MQEFKEAKGDFLNKDVVFVYLTNKSSPQKLWEDKIKGIGGEHYYFTEDGQWEYIMDSFGFEGIPSYILYDKEGKVSDKFTGHPGSDVMTSKIATLLR